VTRAIQLRSDLNTEDDNGDNWALLANAVHSSEVHVGAVRSTSSSVFSGNASTQPWQAAWMCGSAPASRRAT
jgi:hypothetical protein